MASPTPQLSSLQRRLIDLNTYQLPRLRSCVGPIGLHGELADELRLDLAAVRRGLEVAREEVELIEGYEEREGGWRAFEEVEKEYKRAQMEYRSALLHSKSQIATTKTANPSTSAPATSARDQRYELQPSTLSASSAPAGAASGSATTFPPRSADFGRGEQDAVQTKTNEVTDALRRTLGTMQVELEKSVMSVQMLEDSTRTLRSTSALYDTYTSLLTTSTQLVKALERADWWDRAVIALAFLLFLLTVGWVIKRRVLDRVVGGVGWWVGGSARLVKMGLGGGKGAKKIAGKAGTAAAVVGKKAVDKVGKEVKTASVLSGAAVGASTIAAAVASAVSGAKGVATGLPVPESAPSLADSVVAPPPPPPSAISPPLPSAKDEL